MLVITYDEHGGFYDHVIPTNAEARTRPRLVLDLEDSGASAPFISPTLITNYGLRVPTFIVSPWTPAGKGPDHVMDFCSILKTIIARFCGQDKPFLSDRVNASQSFESYLSQAEPRMLVPSPYPMQPLPDNQLRQQSSIVNKPISKRQMRAGNVDYHDLTGMLARMLGRK